MAAVMMSLGGYQFGLDTAAFNELNRSTDWHWPSQDVFGSRPVLQYTGNGEDTITLPGVIFPEYWGGTDQLNTLRDLGDKGEPLTLIDGRGNIMGEWVITGVQERQSIFADMGVARRQEFTLTLKLHSGGFVQLLGAAAAAGVVSGDTDATGKAAAAAANGQGRAASSVSRLQAAAAAVQDIVDSTVTPVQGALQAIGQALSAAQSVRRAAEQAQQAIKALGRIENLSQAQSAMGGLTRASAQATQVAGVASRAVSGIVGAMGQAGDSAEHISAVTGALVSVNGVAVGSTQTQAESQAVTDGFTE